MEEKTILISKEIVEKYIQNFASEINHMDEKHLPEVILELQAEEAAFRSITDYKSVTEFSKETIETVFVCWFESGEGEAWFEEMEAEQIEKNKEV